MGEKKPPRDLAVRRLYAGDKEDICGHFLRLDIQARRARFFGALSDNSVSNYALNILRYDSVVCGAFVSGQLSGLAELHDLFRSWPPTAEAALSIETRWQNKGIGGALFERMFTIAQNRGVRTVRMTCLKDNRRMQHLAFKHHARLLADLDHTEATLHTNWPTPRSVVEEIVGEIRGYSNVYLS
ncbi:MAG: GNAT family N-acetyltransferase [Rhodobacteraceae bacterium]|nr:GNAT family N-acetyltransferase [Paracoccaceae bacterium]